MLETQRLEQAVVKKSELFKANIIALVSGIQIYYVPCRKKHSESEEVAVMLQYCSPGGGRPVLDS